MAVSLRISEDIKRRVERQAAAQNTSAHAFMLEAVHEKLQAEEAKASFQAEAERRLAQMKKSGKAIPEGEVFDYLRGRAHGKAVVRPKARKFP